MSHVYFRFHLKIIRKKICRVLGGSAFGLDNLGEGVQVQCYLITDETAKQLLNNAYLEM